MEAASYKYIAANATTVVKASPGTLKRVIVGSTVANAITIYDSATAAANAIAILQANILPGSFEFNCKMRTGIVVVCAGDAKITVIYE